MEIKYKSKRQEIFLTEFLPCLILGSVCIILFFILNCFPTIFPKRSHCFSSAVFFFAIPLVYVIFKYRFPPILKIIGYSFAFCGMVLATSMSLYTYIPEFDTTLHTISGFMCFLFAFYFLLSTGVIFLLSEALTVVFCLLINAATSSIWELIEYAVDVLLSSNSQHSLEEGVVDTMQDIIANSIGGLICGILLILDILITHKKFTDWFTRRLSVYTNYDYRKAEPLE